MEIKSETRIDSAPNLNNEQQAKELRMHLNGAWQTLDIVKVERPEKIDPNEEPGWRVYYFAK